MNIEFLIENSKTNLGYKWNMDGYHESAYGVPFAIYSTPTMAYKMVISERAIWANEVAILEVNGDMKRAARDFQLLIESSMSKYEIYTPITVDWNKV